MFDDNKNTDAACGCDGSAPGGGTLADGTPGGQTVCREEAVSGSPADMPLEVSLNDLRGRETMEGAADDCNNPGGEAVKDICDDRGEEAGADHCHNDRATETYTGENEPPPTRHPFDDEPTPAGSGRGNEGEAIQDAEGHPSDNNDIRTVLSRILSAVMSPLIMPVLAVMALLYGNTQIGYIPGKMKFYYTLVILINTCVVPILCIGLLHSLGIVKGLLLGNRRDRVLPLMITAVCYVACAFMIDGLPESTIIKKFLLAGAACITLAFIVTFYWKISIHMLAAGGTLAMVMLLHIGGIGDFFRSMILLLAGCGALASARMYLGAHTPMQVGAGFASGFLVAAAVILV